MVVVGIAGGNDGTFTASNGFTLGNNQSGGTASLGTAYKAAAASTETPSLTHSNANRRAIAAVVLEPVETPDPATVTSVTYGGQGMTNVNAVSGGSGFTAATEIWFLNEVGIAAATDGSFLVNWSQTPDLPLYSHAFFSGIDQSDPIGPTATNSSATSTPNPDSDKRAHHDRRRHRCDRRFGRQRRLIHASEQLHARQQPDREHDGHAGHGVQARRRWYRDAFDVTFQPESPGDRGSRAQPQAGGPGQLLDHRPCRIHPLRATTGCSSSSPAWRTARTRAFRPREIAT